jgi:hypothetical protein
VAVRLQFVPGQDAAELIELPWSTPLTEWDIPRLISMARGQSRHVVRFVTSDECVLALKETTEAEARHEYRMLRLLEEESMPAVRASGVVTGRETADGQPLPAVLVTRYLDFSLPFHYLLGRDRDPVLGQQLIDAGVVLLARLHLEGFYWGDCSLSNLLFRRDAGAMFAYLVDAETAEHHAPLPDGMREADITVACENVVGGLLDLQAAGRLSEEIDPVAVAAALPAAYESLWTELTDPEELSTSELHLLDRRIRRINALGFDVAELVVEQRPSGDRLSIRPMLVEEGHHARELQRQTGLGVQENQARRLLADVAAFGACLARDEGHELPQSVVAARWLADVYGPAIEEVPAELRGRLEPPELYHELLEHRYYLSEQAGHEIGNDVALRSYVDTVLRHRPVERLLRDPE